MKPFIPERDGRGIPVVRCVCQDCGEQKTIRCDTVTRSRSISAAPNVGQAVTKLQADGWTFIKQKLRCPVCEAKRKEPAVAKEPTIIEIIPPPAPVMRQPSRDQKRLIVSMLEDEYDTQRQRYKGTETDKSIADTLGDGVMPGWVAAIREDMFGPDGNEEMTDLAAEVSAWMKKADRALATANEAISEFAAARAKVKEIGLRLDKIVAAVGPKAEKA